MDNKGLSEEFIRGKIDAKSGMKRTEVIAGPSMRYDFGLIQISEDKVMGVSTGDAVFLSEITPDKSSYLTFHKSVGKLSSSGILPEYINIDLSLPQSLDEELIAHYWNSINIESKKFQVSITSRDVNLRGNASEPFIGGTTAIGTARMPFQVNPTMVNDGDRVLMSKTSGLEATTLISTILTEFVEEKVGQYNQKLSQKLFFKTSTIQEAQEALNFGFGKQGVTAMKAVGESGIIGAIHEFSAAGGFGLDIDFEKIPLYDEVREICALFNLDPYRTSSMGSMIMTMSEDVADDLSKNLIGNGIDVVDVGKVDKNSQMVKINGYPDGDSNDGRALSVYDILPEIREKK